MKKAIPIDENELSDVSGGVSSNEKEILNIEEGCDDWKCNICGCTLKMNYTLNNAAPECKHYAFKSCRNCMYFNVYTSGCRKK